MKSEYLNKIIEEEVAYHVMVLQIERPNIIINEESSDKGFFISNKNEITINLCDADLKNEEVVLQFKIIFAEFMRKIWQLNNKIFFNDDAESDHTGYGVFYLSTTQNILLQDALNIVMSLFGFNKQLNIV